MTADNVASAAADALVMAAASDTVWPIAEERFAALFGGSQFGPSTQAWLGSTYRALHATPLAQLKGVQGALVSQWTTRIVDLLNEQPAQEAELTFLVTDLQTLLNVLPGNPPAAKPGGVTNREKLARHPAAHHALPGLNLLPAVFNRFCVYRLLRVLEWRKVSRQYGRGLAYCLCRLCRGRPGRAGRRYPPLHLLGRAAPRRGNGPGPGPEGQPGPHRQSPAADQASQDRPSSITPSSNLAEISDWLTKLLLGAGLVELTRLGRPLGTLIDDVATGLGSATSSGKVVAATILLTYVTLGFIDVYIVTTLWYGKHLQDLGY